MNDGRIGAVLGLAQGELLLKVMRRVWVASHDQLASGTPIVSRQERHVAASCLKPAGK